MNALLIFFVAWPYIAFAILWCGLLARYCYAPRLWNSRSSQFLDGGLRFASPLFHISILCSFFGHIIGLVLPPEALRAVGLSAHLHALMAESAGMVIAPCVLLAVCILFVRRVVNKRVRATTRFTDVLVLVLIGFNASTGLYQSYVEHFPVFTTVGPWLRSMLELTPNPLLMAPVPLFLKLHVVSGLTIFALLPFTRLVHIFSAPWTYFTFPFTLYRRRWGGI